MEQDDLVPDSRVREEFDISAMGLWRWDHDPDLNFPPAIRIRGRKYRSRRLLNEFKERLVRQAITQRSRERAA